MNCKVWFQLDEKFDESTPDGREVSSLATFADGKLKIVQTAKKAGQKSTTVRKYKYNSLLFPLFRVEIQNFSENIFICNFKSDSKCIHNFWVTLHKNFWSSLKRTFLSGGF